MCIGDFLFRLICQKECLNNYDIQFDMFSGDNCYWGNVQQGAFGDDHVIGGGHHSTEDIVSFGI